MLAKLGIIGGLGALAGVRMAQQLVELAQEKGASRDEDFPRFILVNVPTRGMDETGFVDEETVKMSLRTAVRMLARMDCEFIVIACNTVHAFFDELNNLTHSEVLNMIELAVDAVDGAKRVGVLCSEVTRKIGLYERALADRGIGLVRTQDREQADINGVISNVMAGRNTDHDAFRLSGIIDNMVTRGAQRVIIGCTELPLALKCQKCNGIVDAGRVVLQQALKLL